MADHQPKTIRPDLRFSAARQGKSMSAGRPKRISSATNQELRDEMAVKSIQTANPPQREASQARASTYSPQQERASALQRISTRWAAISCRRRCPVSWMQNGSARRCDAAAGDAPVRRCYGSLSPLGPRSIFWRPRPSDGRLHRDIVVFDWCTGTFDRPWLREGRMHSKDRRPGASTTYGRPGCSHRSSMAADWRMAPCAGGRKTS